MHGLQYTIFYSQTFFTFVFFYYFTLLTFLLFFIQMLRLEVNFLTFNLSPLNELQVHKYSMRFQSYFFIQKIKKHYVGHGGGSGIEIWAISWFIPSCNPF